MAMRDEMADADAIVTRRATVGSLAARGAAACGRRRRAGAVPDTTRGSWPRCSSRSCGESRFEAQPPKAADAVGQPAEVVLARLIEAATGRAPDDAEAGRGAHAPSLYTDLVAEMC
jgi:hypothetical protein